MIQYPPKTTAALLIASLLLGQSSSVTADDNLLAHKLFLQGDYAQAGEIFTDPAWKGVALYRSSQWWRATEAFVRANDSVSAYNLGNCYVKLGYYALALDAYLQASEIDPAHADAKHNADIMRKLLTEENDEKKRGGRQPTGDELEQLESKKESPEQAGSNKGDKQSAVGDTPTGKSEDAGEQSMGPQQDAQTGKGGETSEQAQQNNDDQDSSGTVNGQRSDQAPTSRPSGGSESSEPTTLSQAAGLRSKLEEEQATAQWLNQINHDAPLYLQRRILLEQKRRRAAGQTAPEGGSNW